MALSTQALNGTKGSKTIRLRGFVAGQEAFMLVDSGSSHCFINEQLASKVSGWQPLPNPVQVRVANGAEILCAYELPDLLWAIQGHTFKCSFKIIPLGCYDVIFGMNWLSVYSPMQIYWADKWLQFNHEGNAVKLQGIQPHTTWGSPISATQLQAMYKTDVVLHLVELHSVEEPSEVPVAVEPIPPAIQEIIDKFSPIFQPLRHLPSPRPRDHTIPLLPGAQPFRIRPYRYNPFQNDEIERQVADLLQKALIQQSSSPFASPVLLVKNKTGD